jgi:hypothetical protein
MGGYLALLPAARQVEPLASLTVCLQGHLPTPGPCLYQRRTNVQHHKIDGPWKASMQLARAATASEPATHDATQHKQFPSPSQQHSSDHPGRLSKPNESNAWAGWEAEAPRREGRCAPPLPPGIGFLTPPKEDRAFTMVSAVSGRAASLGDTDPINELSGAIFRAQLADFESVKSGHLWVCLTFRLGDMQFEIARTIQMILL